MSPIKICFRCGVKKDRSEFGINKKKSDGLQSYCKPCRNEYASQWYKKNSKTHMARVSKSRPVRFRELRKWYFNLLLEKECIDCEEKRPPVLQFDHVGKKYMAVSEMVRRGYSKEKILKEIEQCEVRCANCHAMKTSIDFNWYNF